MTEIDRLSGDCDAIELDFVDREATPKGMMELAIHLHLGGLSLSDTVSVFDNFCVYRARSTVQNWVQKANLEPEAGRDPEKIALDEAFRHETFGERNPVERVFQDTKRRTSQFYNTFSRASPESAEEWLKALSWAWNQLI